MKLDEYKIYLNQTLNFIFLHVYKNNKGTQDT